MLLTEYNHLNEIDTAISHLQAELTELYRERSKIIFSTEPQAFSISETLTSSSAIGSSADNSWVADEYRQLLAAWQNTGVTIPAFEKLRKKLSRTREILDDLALTRTESSFQTLLVPSAKIFEQMVDNGLFSRQNIRFDESVLATAANDKSRGWKIYIVAAQTLIGPLHSASELTPEQLELIPEYKMPGLNVKEYAVFALTNKDSIPENSWSILPRDTDKASGQVPCALRSGDSFQFELDNSDVLIGDNHFRPAMEVTEKG